MKAAAGLEVEVSCLFHGMSERGVHFWTSVSIVSGNVLGVTLINRQACKLLHCITQVWMPFLCSAGWHATKQEEALTECIEAIYKCVLLDATSKAVRCLTDK